MKSQDILPILLSIAVIILVAVLEKQSKFAAAITATMPIGATLAIWIVYSANSGDQQTMKDGFADGYHIFDRLSYYCPCFSLVMRCGELCWV